jgi:hypothetical protein
MDDYFKSIKGTVRKKSILRKILCTRHPEESNTLRLTANTLLRCFVYDTALNQFKQKKTMLLQTIYLPKPIR